MHGGSRRRVRCKTDQSVETYQLKLYMRPFSFVYLPAGENVFGNRSSKLLVSTNRNLKVERTEISSVQVEVFKSSNDVEH